VDDRPLIRGNIQAGLSVDNIPSSSEELLLFRIKAPVLLVDSALFSLE